MSDDASEERWLPVEGWPGYEVSDLGQVRSLDRVVQHRHYGSQFVRGRLLKQTPNRHGYIVVSLSADGAKRNRSVHGLVARAFLGPCPLGQEVCHGPRGQTNNSVTNLSYGTHSSNIRDKRRDGTDHELNKTHCPRQHLLAAPNLVAHHARAGRRGCLACDRAWGYIQYRGISADYIGQVSDAYYAEIMRNAA